MNSKANLLFQPWLSKVKGWFSFLNFLFCKTKFENPIWTLMGICTSVKRLSDSTPRESSPYVQTHILRSLKSTQYRRDFNGKALSKCNHTFFEAQSQQDVNEVLECHNSIFVQSHILWSSKSTPCRWVSWMAKLCLCPIIHSLKFKLKTMKNRSSNGRLNLANSRPCWFPF